MVFGGAERRGEPEGGREVESVYLPISRLLFEPERMCGV